MGKGYFLYSEDKTTCGGRITSGAPDDTFMTRQKVREGDSVTCGKFKGTFRVCGGMGDTYSIGGVYQWAGSIESFSSCPCRARFIPSVLIDTYEYNCNRGLAEERARAEEKKARREDGNTPPGADTPPRTEEKQAVVTPVFAKSCLRGDGCNDAGEQQESHTNFAQMGIFRALPPTDASTDADTPQHAQTAKKKPPGPEDIPKPKKRSALWKWWNGNHEEMDYQAAVAAAAAASRVQTATAGAGVFELVAGRYITYGTWAVRAGGIVAGGIGAPVTGLLLGMMPGTLNEGEQDLIDRRRLKQMWEAPTRVRFTWETNSQGNPAPHGWHTPPGKDMVRVRHMEWDSSHKAWTFTTEEEPRITIIWTPDHSGVTVPSNTGNQARPVLPNPVIVDPLPDSSGITATTTPAPEEKGFADYILVLPVADIPPIYIYLSKPPVEFLEVELYSDFKRRSRQGIYEADHIPSRAAIEAYLKRLDPLLKEKELEAMTNDVAAIVIPIEVHQKLSETYGGRNKPAQIERDAEDLRTAADHNLDTIKPALKEHGATEAQIEAARVKMHKLNSNMGLYKWP